MPKKTDFPEVTAFRARLTLAMNNYAENMIQIVAEDMGMGITTASIKEQSTEEFSRMGLEREAMRKAMKKAAATLINRVHIRAYLVKL